MIEVALTRVGDRLEPFSHEDAEVLRDVPEGVAIRAKLTTPRKQRSYRQLALFWACCHEVAANTDDTNWSTAEAVAEQVKLQLRHIRSWLVQPSGAVHIITGSLAYDQLGHMEACRFFERAWPILADRLGVTVEEMHRHTEEQNRIRSLVSQAS